MISNLCALTMASVLLAAISAVEPALGQKSGGILTVHQYDNPPSLSIHEEVTYATVVPMMGIFNNLVMYEQDEPKNSVQSIVPDLAKSWSWSEDGALLTFQLHQDVKWHDGKPFTASDVKCTWDMLLGRANEKLRTNPRKAWYHNLAEVTTDGDFTVTFHLKRPQPALIALLASGYSAVYPCHVPPRDMRQHPIGTGPFKLVEFKPNESLKVARNPDYWKKDRPYLDGIEYKVIPSRSTAILAFVTGKVGLTFPYQLTVPLLKEVKSQVPDAACELRTTNSAMTLIINRFLPPFDTPGLRRALALALDRKSFVDILTEGKGKIGAAMLPPPEGVWGMPVETMETLPGYGPDVKKNRAEARKLMEELGYGPDKRLKARVAVRNIPEFRDAAVVLIDHLKEIYIDGELDAIETVHWFPMLARKDYQIGLIYIPGGVDDPDQQLYENYACSAERNYSGYCSRELDELFDHQSIEADQEKRRELVWEIDKKLQQDGARPIIWYNIGATCWRPHVKGLTTMVNSIYNGWRFEDVWLDK